MIPKSELILQDYYQSYLDRIKENDFRAAMKENTRQFRKLLESIPRKKYDHSYAEGKWTIRQMVRHIIDTERVFAYRALHLSRKDANSLPGFDEASWNMAARGENQRWKELLEEFKTVRASTEMFFDTLSDDQLRFVGTVNGNPQNAFTLGFLVSGHVAHHIAILKERYLK